MNRPSSLRKIIEITLNQAQQCVLKGDYTAAETLSKKALSEWRGASASGPGSPGAEESRIISLLGKCYEAQHKYEDAYALYMEALPNLKGTAYDDVYTSLLYLTERMGTFKNKADQNPDQNI